MTVLWADLLRVELHAIHKTRQVYFGPVGVFTHATLQIENERLT
jgi:hypothetical protein